MNHVNPFEIWLYDRDSRERKSATHWINNPCTIYLIKVLS